MKKILYVCCNFVYGGVEQYILNTIDYIDRRKYNIEVLLPQKEFYERENALALRNIKVVKYPCNSLKEKVVSFFKLLRREKYDIIHFHTGHESALLCLVAQSAGVKKLIVHGHTSKTGDTNIKKLHLLKKSIIYKLSELIYRKSNIKCIACSNEAAKFMFARNDVQIVKNGIELSKFMNIQCNENEFCFCIIARFDEQKNPLFVVDIMNELVKKNPCIKLEWIGTGHLKTEVENKIKQDKLQDNINIIGASNSVENVLKQNKYFLLPSLYEGLGIVLIEAQAAGMKCFVSDVIPDIADCGGLVKISLDYTAAQWAKIILEELNKNLPLEINKEKLAKYDIRTTTKELEEIYASL